MSSLTAVSAVLKSPQDTPRDTEEDKLHISQDGDKTLMNINTEESNSVKGSSIMSSVMESQELPRTSLTLSIEEKEGGDMNSSSTPHGNYLEKDVSTSSDSSRYNLNSSVPQEEADAGVILSSAIHDNKG